MPTLANNKKNFWAKLKGSLNESSFRLVYGNGYFFTLKDVTLSFNINLHSFDCYALSFEEAYGKMILECPQFRGVAVHSVLCDGKRMDLPAAYRSSYVFKDCLNQKEFRAMSKRNWRQAARKKKGKEQSRIQFVNPDLNG